MPQTVNRGQAEWLRAEQVRLDAVLQPLTKAELAKHLAALALVQRGRTGADVSPEGVVALFHRALCDLPGPCVRAGFEAHLREETFFPAPSEIRRRARGAVCADLARRHRIARLLKLSVTE